MTARLTPGLAPTRPGLALEAEPRALEGPTLGRRLLRIPQRASTTASGATSAEGCPDDGGVTAGRSVTPGWWVSES